MAVTFTYDIGYTGYAKFKSIPILATDGKFSYQHNPIYSTAIYGAYAQNAPDKAIFAPDYPQVTANLGFELTHNGSDNLFLQLAHSITTNRYLSNQVEIYPNGTSGYKSNMYTQSLEYSTSQDELVTGNITFKSTGVKNIINENISHIYNSNYAMSSQGYGISGNASINNITQQYIDVFPYYASIVSFSNTQRQGINNKSRIITEANLEKDIISWNISTNQNIQFVKFCSCYNDDIEDLQAQYACIGLQSANGSIQFFGINQRLQDGEQFYFYDDQTTIKLNRTDGSTLYKIIIPKMELTNIGSGLTTGSNLITTSIDFDVIGNPSKHETSSSNSNTSYSILQFIKG